MVHSECSFQIFILKGRLLASNENGVAVRFVRWGKSERASPACCRLAVGTEGHHEYPDVGRTVLLAVLEGHFNSATNVMSLLYIMTYIRT